MWSWFGWRVVEVEQGLRSVLLLKLEVPLLVQTVELVDEGADGGSEAVKRGW